MNKIYRTVYNETTGTWVAVCETAKTHTKSSGSTVDNATASVSGSMKAYSLTAVTAAAALLSPLMANQAQADVLCKGAGNQLFVKATCDSGEETINLAFGANNTTTIAQGSNAFAAAGGQASSAHTIAIGVNSIAKGDGSIALGSGESGNSFNKSGSYANGNGNIAIGKKAEAVGAKDIGFVGTSGNYTLPQGDYDDNGHQYSYDRTITENGSQMIAIGDNASAYNDQAIAIGGNTVATGYASISIGGDDIGLVGKRNTETINYLEGTLIPELQKDGLAVSNTLNRTILPNNTQTGEKPAFQDLTLAKGASSIAFGFKSVAEGELSNAFGTGARSVGLNSTAFGSFAAAFGKESIAFGTATETATGADYATSIGYMSQIGQSGEKSVALGYKNKVQGNTSAAIGQNNTVSVADTFVLGSGVTGDTTNSVYLGKGSTTATTKGGAGLNQVKNATVNDITYGDFAGQNAQGIVSVGTGSSARRIQNVAAGAINADSTDAINGSQLFAVLPKYTTDTGTGKVTSVQVGNQTYNFAAADGNDITELTVNDYQAAGNTTGNLKLTDQGSGDSHNYNVALNNTVELGDNTADGSLTVGNQKGDSKTEINPNSINFTNQNGGSITNVASHLKDQAPTDTAMNDANNPSNFGNMKNEAATVGDVLNAGWNLQVADDNGNLQAADFVQHGDTVKFGDSDTVNAKYDGGVIKFSVNTTMPDPVITDPAKPNVGKVVIKSGDENKIVTAGDLATAINSSGWVASDSTKNAFVATGDKVTIVGAGGTTVELNDQNKTFTVKSVEISKYDGTPNTQNADATVTEITDADGNKYKIGGGSSGDENWNLTVDGDNTNATSPNAQRNLKDSNTVNVTQDGNNITFDVITTPLSVVDSGDQAGSVNTVKNEDKNKLVTAGDVANVVNNTYWTASDGSKTTPVKASDTVTFKGKTDGNVTVTNNNGTFEFAVKTADKDPAVTGITSQVGGNDGDILTAKQITQTINQVAENWKWNIQGQDDGVVQDTAAVQYDNTVKINAKDGLKLEQNGQTINLTGLTISKSDPATTTGGNATATELTDADGNKYNIGGTGSGDENWNLTVNGKDSTVTKPNAKRNLRNLDQNIDISQDGLGNITFDLATVVKIGDASNPGHPIIINGDEGKIQFEDYTGVIDGVKNHFENVGSAKEMPTANNPSNFTGATNNQTNQAATLGDVLNAGWGLKANGSAVDFVAHGDTVDFVSTDKSITIKPSVTDGKDSVLDLSANVKFYSDDAGTTLANAGDTANSVSVGDTTYKLGGDSITNNYYGNGTVSVTGKDSVKVESTTDSTTQHTTYTVSIETTTPETVITDPAKPNVGKVVIASGDENKIVTAGDLATAINSSGWVASDGKNQVLVQAGNTATIQGKNGVKVGLDAKTQTFTVESDYVFKDKDGNDVTNAGGDVTAIETTDDAGKTITYNIGGGDGNDITSLTAQGENANSTTGNLKLTDKGTGDSHQYDIALNNDVQLGDDKGNSGSLNVNNGTGGSTNIEGNKITFGDTTTPNSGSIDGLAQHFTKTGDTTAPNETADTASGKADNQAATVGDVKNVGWNLKVGDTVQDFVNHGDTVAFADGTGTKAKYDNTTGAISFDIAKAGDSKIDTTVTNANAGKVTGGKGDEYWDSKQVQDAINNAGWKAGTGATANAQDELINAGDRVGLVAGQGVQVTQDGSNFTFATDYVFKDGKGDDITNKGGDVAKIETTDDKGNTITYNIGGGDGNDNTVTAVTVNGGQDATANQADGGNLKLEEKTDANGNPTYDIALNDEVDLTDKGSLKVGGDDIANGSPVTNITAGNIDFGDQQGSITNVASHLKDPASKDDKGQVINPDNAPANFNSVKNEAATVGDVLNAGWNLKVGGQDADFVQHGDTVAFGNGTGTTAQYDATNGVISFDIAKASNPIIPAVGKPNAGTVTGGTANQYWDSVQVQDAINGAGWFATAGAKGSGKVTGTSHQLVTAGNEVKFIAGDGMEIEQNGSEFTFKVTGGGAGTGTGTGTGGGWTVIDPNNPNDIDINGGGQDVEFVGDVNTNVKVERPKQSGDPVGIQVGLNDKVYVGGTSDGTATGTPNAGSVTIDGSNPNGAGAITFNNQNPDNSVTVNGDSGSLNLGQGANNNPVNITNVNKGADGSNDAVNVAQIEDVVGAANKDANGVVKTTGTNGEEYTLKTYNVEGQTEYLTNNVVEAVSKMNEQGIKFVHTNDGVVTPEVQAQNTVDSSAKGAYSTSIGYQAQSNQENGVSLGKGALSDGVNAIAVGAGAEATGEKSISVGAGNIVSGNSSTAIGDPNVVTGTNSHVLGNDNTIDANNTVVVGNNVTVAAGMDGAVVLGDGSDGAATFKPTNDATVGGITYSGFAGNTSTIGDGSVVSVGSSGAERQIKNVAAGEISATSTDAINGSQLYAVLPQYTVGSNGKVDNVTVGDKTYDFANYDFKGADGVNVNVDGATNTVTISGTPGYASGIKAGENVVFNYEDNTDAAGNPLYVTTTGGTTTDATDPNVKRDANGDPVKQQTTVINAKQPDLRPIEQHVQQVENNAYAGVAQAMATAGLPQAYLPGKSMVAIAGGHYKGEQGYALGLSSISDSGNWVFKATASGNSRGNVGGTIGAGYQW